MSNKKTYKTSKTKFKAIWVRLKRNIYCCTNCDLFWIMSNRHSLKKNEMNYCPKCGMKIVDAEEKKGAE